MSTFSCESSGDKFFVAAIHEIHFPNGTSVSDLPLASSEKSHCTTLWMLTGLGNADDNGILFLFIN